MTNAIIEMTAQHASTICNWKYQAPYALYSMDGSDDCICEFTSGSYYAAVDESQDLIGYLCSGQSARVPGGYACGIYEDDHYLDIGLGLKPEYTGKGKGLEFVLQGLEFFRRQHQVQSFRLVVATFNERAIKVYERAGFVKGICFTSMVFQQEIQFMVMHALWSGTFETSET